MCIADGMEVYRIQKDQYRATILKGEGARLYGGRWNAVGTPLVYTSSSMELALLEATVHLDGTPPEDMPPYVLVTLNIPDDTVYFLNVDSLPPGWSDYEGYPATEMNALLRAEFSRTNALAIAVPSVILPKSKARNILINPLHPNIGDVNIANIDPHTFDPRLP